MKKAILTQCPFRLRMVSQKEAKDVLEIADMENMRSTALNGYHIVTTEVEYGGVKQRWVVVFSEKAFARETKTLEKKIEMVYTLAERTLREALEKVVEAVPDQKGKPTKKPTIRRVFQVFVGITALYKGSEMVKVLNMKPIDSSENPFFARS
jgi:transposase